MKTAMRLSVAILVSALCLSVGQAQTKSGTQLQEHCSEIDNETDSYRLTYCLGYVTGLLDGREAGFIDGYERGRRNTGPVSRSVTHELDRLSRTGEVAGFCRKGQTIGQVIRIINRYLKDHPDRAGEPAATLFIDILRETYPPPCSQ